MSESFKGVMALRLRPSERALSSPMKEIFLMQVENPSGRIVQEKDFRFCCVTKTPVSGVACGTDV